MFSLIINHILFPDSTEYKAHIIKNFSFKYLSSILVKLWFVTEDIFIRFKGSYSHYSLESFEFLAPVLLNINLARKTC